MTNPALSDGRSRPLTMEDRVDRLESQVWELRSLLRASGLGAGTQKEFEAAASKPGQPLSESPSVLNRWFSPINRFVRNWVLVPLGIIQSISWLRRMVILVLGAAILFSNWWLPLSGLWFLGGIYERLVLLVLAGIWWYLFWGGWSQLHREKKRPFGKAGTTGWFGSRAS